MQEFSQKIEIYQIGYGAFGRKGFEKIIELAKENEFLEFRGLAEINPDRRSHAAKLAKGEGMDIEIFSHTLELYQKASKSRNKVLIYDSGPTELHSSHILKSCHFGFWHLSEKPPCLTKPDFERISKAKGWLCNTIEEENEVVLAARKYLKTNDLEIKSIRAFRESSFGIHKVLGGCKRPAITGGCLLDKASHEKYIFSLIKATGEHATSVNITKAKGKYLMIESYYKDSFIDIYGHPSKKITKRTATAQSCFGGIIQTDKKKIPFSISVGWVGASKEGKKLGEMIKEKTGYEILKEKQISCVTTPYSDLRLFILDCGDLKLYGELKEKRLFSESEGVFREISIPNLKRDQLYRVLENAALLARGGIAPDTEDLSFIMNAIFDAREIIEIDLEERTPEDELKKTKGLIEKFCENRPDKK